MGSVGSGALMSGLMGLYTGKAAPVVNNYVQKALPGVAKAVQNVAESSVVKWLGDNEVRDTISRDFLVVGGLHTAIGAGMMAANSAVTSAATESAKGLSPGLEAKWAATSLIRSPTLRMAPQAIKDLWLFSAVPAVQAALQERGSGSRPQPKLPLEQ